MPWGEIVDGDCHQHPAGLGQDDGGTGVRQEAHQQAQEMAGEEKEEVEEEVPCLGQLLCHVLALHSKQ